MNYHQYTCGNSTDNSCSSVRFVHGVYASTAVYYVTLSNGISVNDILDVTLTNSSNTTSSTIKIAVDTWYSTEMIGYTNKLEDTMYCNDRSIYSLGGWNPDGGSISSPLYFGIRERRSITFQPTLTCNKNDAFTVTESSAGNGKLTYPVGLITADEFIMAGGAGNMLKQSNIYLQHGTYWTMTPLRYSKEGIGEILHIDASLANSISGNHSNGIRPMISLKNSIRISSGEGTVANPFIIE